MAGFPRRVILPGTAFALVVTLGVAAWVLATVSSEAVVDATANCPLRNKWAISVWVGADDTDTSAALATCGPDAVAAAFALDPETQTWSRWYAGRPDASSLRTLDHLQGVIALGSARAPASPTPALPTLTPTTTSTPTPIPTRPPQPEPLPAGCAPGASPSPSAPNAPSSLWLEVAANPNLPDLPPTVVVLRWTDNSADESCFAVERRVGDGPWQWLSAVSANQRGTYGDGFVGAETQCYRVYAGNEAGRSDYSEIACLGVPPSPGAIHSCPLQGRWAISVWSGPNSTDIGVALATCGPGNVAAAFGLDPQTQMWSAWFAKRPDISDPLALNNLQGVITLGGPRAPATPTPTPYPTPTPTPTRTPTPTPIITPTRTPTPTPIVTPTPAPTPGPFGRIAFTSDRDGNAEIYVMTGLGSGQTRLTYDPAADGSPAWSPDGSQIAFTSDRDGDPEVYVMNADGTGQTNLTNNSAGEDFGPTWSPDGSQIAFVSNSVQGNYDIWVMNAHGSGQIRLTTNSAEDLSPDWSPDGSQIAFVSRRDGNDEIYVMNADGTGQTRLTNDPAFDLDPDWSPDGSQIAFRADRDGNPEIYVMNADGSSQTNLTNSSAWDESPVWSPAGAHIAFARFWPFGDFEIYGMNADGSSPSNLTNDPAADDRSPDWSW